MLLSRVTSLCAHTHELLLFHLLSLFTLAIVLPHPTSRDARVFKNRISHDFPPTKKRTESDVFVFERALAIVYHRIAAASAELCVLHAERVRGGKVPPQARIIPPRIESFSRATFHNACEMLFQIMWRRRILKVYTMRAGFSFRARAVLERSREGERGCYQYIGMMKS